MTAQTCNNLCSYDSQTGNGSGMCKHTKAVVWIEKHGLRWCQSTVTTSRARARDVQQLTRDEPLTSAKTFT